METTKQLFVPAEDEARIREAAVREARSWLGTPFHDHARVKGAGVDCATLLFDVYEKAGVNFGPLKLCFYSTQWHLHSPKEMYLDNLRLVAGEVSGPPERIPKPADIAVYRYANYGNVFNHAGIVIEWPLLIHVTESRGTLWGNAEIDCELKDAPRKIFSFWQ